MSNKHHDWATVWVPASLDIYGSPTFSPPIQVECRWQEGERRYITENGTEARGRHTVYIDPSNESSIPNGSYLARGQYADLTPISGSWEIKQRRLHKNLSGTKSEFRLIL